jgi:glycosyltransferase involved in cell wall biosynthesis
VIVKDGPLLTCHEKIIERYVDAYSVDTINLLQNAGLAVALNEGLKYCRNDLVARMDSDDISFPERFKIQFDFMTNNPKIVASSAWIAEFDNDINIILRIRKVPSNMTQILKYAKFRSPLNHIPSIFRKSIVLKVGGYPEFRKAQDYGLWSLLLSSNYCLANIPTVLAYVRVGRDLKKRRGLEHLDNEIKLLKYQKKIGFLKAYEFYRNIVIRIVLRMSPTIIKKMLYRIS